MNDDKFETGVWDQGLDSVIEAKLRHDASNWSAEPSAAGTAGLQSRLATLGQPRRQVGVPLAAAALVALVLSIWSWGEPVVSETAPAAESKLAQAVVGSLQRELDAVTADATAIASTLTGHFSEGILGFINHVNGSGAEER